MKEDDDLVLFEALVTGDPSGAIRNQEARGQQKLVHSDVLPIECPRAELEQLGFVFGEPVDELFVSVTMPDGWKKQGTDHSMWSDLLDHKGRKRAGIFYKAAFYDRRADMSLTRRFGYGAQPVGGWESGSDVFHAVVMDCGRIIWESEKTPPKPAGGNLQELTDWYGYEDSLEKQARAWLDENYPDWQNPLAYWEAD